MSLQVEKLEKNMAKLTIEVSAEDLEKAIEKVYQKQKNISNHNSNNLHNREVAIKIKVSRANHQGISHKSHQTVYKHSNQVNHQGSKASHLGSSHKGHQVALKHSNQVNHQVVALIHIEVTDPTMLGLITFVQDIQSYLEKKSFNGTLTQPDSK